jgi:hypothetical protein
VPNVVFHVPVQVQDEVPPEVPAVAPLEAPPPEVPPPEVAPPEDPPHKTDCPDVHLFDESPLQCVAPPPRLASRVNDTTDSRIKRAFI